MGNRLTLRTTPRSFAGLALHLRVDHHDTVRFTSLENLQVRHDYFHQEVRTGLAVLTADHNHTETP